MTTFANGESSLSVRTKINNVLQHADGTAGELVINEAGADVDFRVESDTNANALFVDGATGNVGIGTSSPGGKLAVVSGSSAGSSISTWANYAVFGPNAGSSTGSALGLSYNTGSDVAEIAAIAPGVAWKPINILSESFRVTTNNGERLRIDASGNLGLGVTPSAWGGVRTFDVPGGFYGANTGGTGLYWGQNTYFDGTNWRYKTTAAASYHEVVGNVFRWYNAPSGTAGNAITFTQAMTLDASGNLLIGTTSSGGSKLRISGLPTSSAGLSAGDVWNDGGTLKIA